MLEMSRFLQSYLSIVVYPGHRQFFPRNRGVGGLEMLERKSYLERGGGVWRERGRDPTINKYAEEEKEKLKESLN
jgi:hypothetical protein